MKVNAIRIQKVMGIDALEIQPGGAPLLISGTNGSGKTSILEAIRSVVGKGHDATLLRSGSDKGEVVLVFDDGTELRETITPTKTQRTLTHPLYGKQAAKADYLTKLLKGVAANPVVLLTAKDGDVTTTLLSAMPLTITSEDVAKLTGQPEHVESYRFPCSERHALVILSELEKAAFDQRTGVNRALKEKTGTIDQLTGTLPPAPEACSDWAGRVTEIQAELDEVNAERAAAFADLERIHELAAQTRESTAASLTARIEGDITSKRIAIETALEAAIERLRADAALKIQGLQAELLREQSAIASDLNDTNDAAREETDARRVELEAEYGPRIAELDRESGHARAMAEQDTRATTQREIIATMETERDTLHAEAARLTSTIDAVRTAKTRLTKDLPLAGVEIVEGVVHVEGIPWCRVNESRRIRLAVDMVALQAGEWKACIVDGIEALDTTTFLRLSAALEAAGIQGILAKVADTPLTVRTGAEAAA